MLQDMVVAAANEALRKARRLPKHKNGGNGELSNATNDEENDNI